MQLSQFQQNLTREMNEKLELQQILRHGSSASAEAFANAPAASVQNVLTQSTGVRNQGGQMRAPLLDLDVEASVSLNELYFAQVTGVVAVEEKIRFERMVFRASRGNCFMQFFDISHPIIDPGTGKKVEKCVFIIIFKSSAIEDKVRRICDAFHASIYSVPTGQEELDTLVRRNEREIVECKTVLGQNRRQSRRACLDVAKDLQQWTFSVRREKAIYHTLNLFRTDLSGMLRAEGWVVAAALNGVRGAVRASHAVAGGGSDIPSGQTVQCCSFGFNSRCACCSDP